MPASSGAAFAAALLHMAQTLTTNIMQKHEAPNAPTDGQHRPSASLASLTAVEDALLRGCCVLQAETCLHLATESQQQQQSRSERPQQHQEEKQSSSERPQSEIAILLSTAVSQLRGVLAASKHGKLTGTAASSLGSVLNSALTAQFPETHSQPSSAAASEQTAKAPAQHAQHSTVAHLNDSELRGGLSDLMAAGDQVAKLPGAALGKQGVSMGLSSLLAGAVGSNGKAAGSGLLSKAGWSRETDDTLQVWSRN